MKNYKVKIKLANDEEIEYGISDSTVTYSDAPQALTNKEQALINQILINVMARIAAANIKRLEIERE